MLNLLLETARIALDEDIPIYVIFTMRSDYIGQCAAFRGLPEYIGFSQFFVPRLNRSQLQQVIEEPATLSGNRIARRLTERLIQDLTEGVDQLPILQHALKQIWIAAESGHDEMDLLHYAMVGGMSVQELPDEQVQKFNGWFAALPAEIKACYHAPNLQNVLDTHTNKLYEQSAGYYQAKTGQTISDTDAKTIIRTAFTCLTKIDQSRAVRNRMTLQEITYILGNAAFDDKKVGDLLNIFREPANTFINPFISEDDESSRSLQPDTVLDITHESLIRNWQYLGQWAKEEFDSHSVSLDFEKQLDRWVNSGRSNNFLLSIGPLTYFENWYNKAKPNAWWIARYLPEETNNETKLQHASEILDNSRSFLKKSAGKHVITRSIIRYGPKRIAVLLGIIALITLSSFTIRNYFRKQNDYVLKGIHAQTMKLVGDPKVDRLSKSFLIAEELKEGMTTFDETVASVHDSIQKISVLNGIASLLVMQGRSEPKKEMQECLVLIDSLLDTTHFPLDNPAILSAVLKEINLYRVDLEMNYDYMPDTLGATLRIRNAVRSARLVKRILETQPVGFDDIRNLNLALESAINFRVFTNEEIKQILKILSPFENGLQTKWLQTNFQADKLSIRGSEAQNYGFKHNGLYQELAYCYAAVGDGEKSLQCLDTLLANSQNNYQGDYAWGGDNATNIAAVFFKYDHSAALDSFVNGYCARRKMTATDFYEHMIARSLKGFETSNNLRLYPFFDETLNLNLKFCGRKQLDLYFGKYRESIGSDIMDADQKNYLLALSYKNEGILKSVIHEEPSPGDPGVNGLFDRAMSYYHAVNPNYLNASTQVIDDAAEIKLMARKFLFVFPDYRTSFHPMEPRSYMFFIFSDAFLDYIVSNHLVESFYAEPRELNDLTQWLNYYNTVSINSGAFMLVKPRFEVLKKLEQEIAQHNLSGNGDLNWLYLYLGKDAQDAGKQEEAIAYYDKIDKANIFNMLAEKNFFGFIRDQSFRMIAYAVEGYVKAGKPEKAHQLVALFKNPVNRSSLYSFTAIDLMENRADPTLYNRMIDSAYAELNRKENSTNEQPNRGLLAYAICMQNPSENLSKAYGLIRNLRSKFEVSQLICRSFGFHQELYDAQINIPEYNSGADQAQFLWNILYGYYKGKGETKGAWENYIQGYPPRIILNLRYVNENN